MIRQSQPIWNSDHTVETPLKTEFPRFGPEKCDWHKLMGKPAQKSVAHAARGNGGYLLKGPPQSRRFCRFSMPLNHPQHTQTTEDLLDYSGIDLHRDTCSITTLDDSGRKVKAKNLPTDPEQIAQYLTDLPGDHRAVVECTTGWYWLSDLCQDLGIDLILAHAKYLKAIAYATVKTDTVDARTMAHVLRLGFIPEAHQIARERRGLRDLLRHRLRLVQTRSRLQTQARKGGWTPGASEDRSGSMRSIDTLLSKNIVYHAAKKNHICSDGGLFFLDKKLFKGVRCKKIKYDGLLSL